MSDDAMTRDGKRSGWVEEQWEGEMSFTSIRFSDGVCSKYPTQLSNMESYVSYIEGALKFMATEGGMTALLEWPFQPKLPYRRLLC